MCNIVETDDIAPHKRSVSGYSGSKHKMCSILDTDYLALRDYELI